MIDTPTLADEHGRQMDDGVTMLGGADQAILVDELIAELRETGRNSGFRI